MSEHLPGVCESCIFFRTREWRVGLAQLSKKVCHHAWSPKLTKAVTPGDTCLEHTLGDTSESTLTNGTTDELEQVGEAS